MMLIGKFTGDSGYRERSHDGKFYSVVEDVKSPATRKETAYRLRTKLFKALYPNIEFREV